MVRSGFAFDYPKYSNGKYKKTNAVTDITEIETIKIVLLPHVIDPLNQYSNANNITRDKAITEFLLNGLVSEGFLDEEK